MAGLKFKNITKVYDNGFKAVDNFNLEIKDEEFIVFVGPSGCGKSTTLRMVAGLEEISDGELYIGDTLVNDIPPKERDIAMVFQNYALYPHMTVYDNMAFALKLRKTPKDEIDKKVREAAKILNIGEQLLDRKPKALSGGQRQRVAMGRAIVRNPKVFLMDEPLSNLDAKLRVQMRSEIAKLYHKLKSTFIYVTHDQTEAMTLGTRIVVMNEGVIQQVDTPKQIYDHPANLFVASFIGSPQMNVLFGQTRLENNRVVINVLGQDLYLNDQQSKMIIDHHDECKEVILGVRPENISIDPDEFEGKTVFESDIEVAENLGSDTYLHVEGDGKAILIKTETSDNPPTSGKVKFVFDMDKIHIFDEHQVTIF